jgi:beta-aspartyl-peptidase (threonine type)
VGYKVLKETNNPIDAVEAAVKTMELNAIFNAGYGSVLTRKREVEMDACIVDGKTMKTGAVTGVKNIYHPVSLARRVMEKMRYNFLGSSGAMNLARSENFQILPKGTLETKNSQNSLDRWLASQNLTFMHELGSDTVGAVAIDSNGNLAAATSTGGITGKLSSRIGDAPIFGAGTYANENFALSATGTGEAIMKAVLCYDIVKRVQYLNENLSEASQNACDDLVKFDGTAGVIALDKDGNVGIGFSSNNMAWAYQKDNTLYYGISRGDNFTTTVSN